MIGKHMMYSIRRKNLRNSIQRDCNNWLWEGATKQVFNNHYTSLISLLLFPYPFYFRSYLYLLSAFCSHLLAHFLNIIVRLSLILLVLIFKLFRAMILILKICAKFELKLSEGTWITMQKSGVIVLVHLITLPPPFWTGKKTGSCRWALVLNLCYMH